jgi:Staphylococcal nuclease homologue
MYESLVVFCIVVLFFSLVPNVLNPFSSDARCQNGYHKSPSGDCEKVTHGGGLPRCPDGFHRSPDGDCERVSPGSSQSDDDGDKSGSKTEVRDDDSREVISSLNSRTPILQMTGCKGSADCFRGIVTEIVDGDTLDVNNVRIRLSMVDTPEKGDPGYDEATDATESRCPVGSEALVDEDDGQTSGSYGRLIGVVYCNESRSSLNELLLAAGKAVLYEDFCEVSEFANDDWVTRFGC